VKREPLLPIGFHVDLILNQLRNRLALEVLKEIPNACGAKPSGDEIRKLVADDENHEWSPSEGEDGEKQIHLTHHSDKIEDAHDDDGRIEKRKRDPEAEREYIEHRLRQIAEWERRISGPNKKRME
jgi:hypothetical protein